MADLHDSTEHYLSTIFEIEEEGIEIKRARIAERLNISAPSVTEHIQRMEKAGLVELNDNNAVVLTKEGKKRATEVVRRHRLAERLLVDVIGLDWEKAHHEADRWEHVISDEVEEKLVVLLGNPDTCPHGNPIPNPDGSKNAEAISALKDSAPLADATIGNAVVRRIGERIEMNEEWLHFVAVNKLMPSTEITIISSSAEVIEIETRSQKLLIPRDIGQSIYVTAR